MQELVREIGAAAGLAAGVGLALLSVLHLSQAREIKRLREWAVRASERSGRRAPALPGRAAEVPQTAASASGAPASSTGPRPATHRIGTRHVALAVVGLLVLGGTAAYGVTQLAGGDGGEDSRHARADENRGSGKPKPNGAEFKPDNVTVAVLNGTTVPGLAAALGDQIAGAGFKTGTIDIFSDQQLAESVVQYAPGHEAEAKAVGRRVGISEREPITADSRALAADATLIVIAGADKAP